MKWMKPVSKEHLLALQDGAPGPQSIAFSCLRNVAERLNSMVYGRYQELVSIVFMGFINQDLHKIGGTILYISIS